MLPLQVMVTIIMLMLAVKANAGEVLMLLAAWVIILFTLKILQHTQLFTLLLYI